MNLIAINTVILLLLVTFQSVTSDQIAEKTISSSTTPLALLSSSLTTESWPSGVIDKSPDRSTMRDMTKAFSVVISDQNEARQLISKMFDLSLMNPAYVFRLPQGDGAKQSLLTMRKSDFVQPIFPNLTAPYVQLMKNKEMIRQVNYDEGVKEQANPTKGDKDLWNRVRINSIEEDDPTLFLNLQTEQNFIQYVNDLNKHEEDDNGKKKSGSDDWSSLGLHGWTGVLSKPKRGNDQLIFNDRPIPIKSTFKEKSSPKWDLPGNMQQSSLKKSVLQAMQNSSLLKIVGNFTQAAYRVTNTHSIHSDTDVYIGRVNDPFGHSSKWDFKNSSVDSEQDERKKRAVIELYSMIKCSTGCDPIVYKGYGCYCGFLGDGYAVDGIDQCCKLHDKCYEYSNCISYLEYFVPYIWKCYRGKPLCAIDHGEWGGPSSCAARLCQCDLLLSRCLRRFVCPQRRAICKTSRSRMLQNLLFNF